MPTKLGGWVVGRRCVFGGSLRKIPVPMRVGGIRERGSVTLNNDLVVIQRMGLHTISNSGKYEING